MNRGRKLPGVEGETRTDVRVPDQFHDITPKAAVRPSGLGGLERPLPTLGWRRLRWAAYAVYFAALAWVCVTHGVPTQRAWLAVIIMTGLGLTSIGHTWRHARQVLVDWLPFSAVLLLYDRTRGVADKLGISLHESDIVHAEKWCFGGTEPTIWLQQHLYNPSHVYWYDALCTLIYTSHFLATPILAAILWIRDRALWLRHISRVILLSVTGLITYCVFPEAPPWLAARDGLTAPVFRLSARGWIWLHIGNLNKILADAQNDGTNPVAAMPSLHVAFATLVAIMIGTRMRSRWRYLLALYPAAMGFTLVYCGEHYVLDLVAGVIYALAVHLILNAWEARRRARADVARSDPAEPPAAETRGAVPS